MARALHFLVFAVLCAAAPAAWAVQVPGLYEAEVSVPDRSAASRKSAISTALRVVIVRLTGDRHAPERPVFIPILRLAEDYVQQDQYRDVIRRAAAEGGTDTRELRLWIRFDEPALNADLRDAGIPIWDRERPATLVWLALGDASGRSFVTPDEHPEFVAIVDERARSRGLVLVFPLLDLQDTVALQASDIWGGFSDPILEASRRYQSDSTLTGSIESPSPGIWEGRWTAYLGGETISWTSEGDLLESVLEEGIDGMGDYLAAKYVQAGRHSEAKDVDITVSDIATVDDYARALQYLTSLSSVAGVQVTRVESGQVTFSLSVHGGEPAIAQAIAFGRTLEPVAGGESGLYRLLR